MIIHRNGAYFVTVCTQDKQKILCEIAGGGVLDAPYVKLTDCGKIAEKIIHSIENVYAMLPLIKYVIMPNHVHLIIRFHDSGGPSRTPALRQGRYPILFQHSSVSATKNTGSRFGSAITMSM
jgi:putative transposase